MSPYRPEQSCKPNHWPSARHVGPREQWQSRSGGGVQEVQLRRQQHIGQTDGIVYKKAPIAEVNFARKQWASA